jgi:hypothetical protein
MEPHEKFLELCALSTSGDLTEAEDQELQAHLACCAECRQALTEFEAAVHIGVPLLSSKLAVPPTEHTATDRPTHAEFAPLSAVAPDREEREGNCPTDSGRRVFAFAHRNGRGPTRVNWNYVWLPFAASVLLSVALATYTYRVGKSRHVETRATDAPINTVPTTDAIEQQISDADHEKQLLKAQLVERDRLIGELRHKIDQQSSALDEMKTAEVKLEQSIETDGAEKQRWAEDRTTLAQKLDTAQVSLQTMQAELESARQQKSQGQSQDTSLTSQILNLNGQLHEREQTINKQEDLLSHDRDIRDLMGARDLYIAEVYDVGRDGATQKPFGRVFYTKGKSLVFYAYDLDQQAGVVRDAKTFQAWGRRGGDMREALNLGIFFQDNAAKKRWVLKFDDAKSLEQIDAVFVTVEPNGPSQKPSGKPLLFAYLKIDPNHP